MSAKFEIHFHAPVGQNINNVEHMDVHVGKDGNVQVMNTESLNIDREVDSSNSVTESHPSEDVLENIIFSKLFDSNQKLLLLRKEIAGSIDLGASSPFASDIAGMNRTKINPQNKNDWFFILDALQEAGTLRNKPVTDVEFVQQMVRFFPMLPNLNFETTEEYDKCMRKFAQSISVERRKWKINGNVVRLVDLQAKQHRLPQLSEEKIARIIRIAMPLYVNLTKLMQELRK